MQNRQPENTAFDKRRHEEMRLKPLGYGYHRVPGGPKIPIHCEKCGLEINGQRVLINNRIYHYECF